MVSLCKPDKCALSFEWKTKSLNTETAGESCDISPPAQTLLCAEGPSLGCRAERRAEVTWPAGGGAQTEQLPGRSCCRALWMSGGGDGGGRAQGRQTHSKEAATTRSCEQRPVAGYSSQ